jgi:ATP-dependent helicase/nuclease subunit A
MTARDAATQAQVEAARPDLSTWLSANAGSGKTRVLTDRVARLLLDGVDPQHILCLTYTKAAASEMQNRLFRRLGAWAMLADGALKQELDLLGHEGVITDQTLREARRLFARAIETPGGLKIQTIHSFCASLLRRFPLEAGVTPQFTEMEDRTATLLRAEIVEELAAGPHASTFYALARHSGKTDRRDRAPSHWIRATTEQCRFGRAL